MPRIRFALLLTCVTLAVSTVVAQAPNRVFFGGPGGRGGMPFGGPGSMVMLIQTPEVQQELKITEEQKTKLTALQADVQEKMQAAFAGMGPGQADDVSQEEREKRFAESRKKIDEANIAAEAKIDRLLQPEQLARMQQLKLQREGAAAIGKPEVAEQLKLTEEQKTKIKGLAEQGMGGFGPPRVNQQALTDAVALLTDEQKAKWRTIAGAEFKFPEMRGPGGPGHEERKLVKDYDKDGDGRLNAAERKEARKAPKPQRGPGFNMMIGGPGGPGGARPVGPGGPQAGPGGAPGGPGGNAGGPRGFMPFGRTEPGKPGPKVSPADVQPISDTNLYSPHVLRTLFLDFEDADWEAEMADFNNTDVEVPATLTVDGKKYPNVGVHFRGMSSFGGVPAGSKRSLNVSLDFVDSKQRLYGYKTLNLLNAHEDPSFLHTVLYSHIARQYIPAPKANLVKVVINGESWGVYANAQQFDKVFVAENFKDSKGTRWKVGGSPGGDAGLDYVGDKIEDYKRRYEMKSNDDEQAWQALIALCRTLKQTPPDQLEAALEPILDIDGALWFLALDNALINNDGYWVRASDYCIFRDGKGKFHIIPHDMNEAFHAAMGGPGMMRMPLGGPGPGAAPGGNPFGPAPGGNAPGGAPGGAPGMGGPGFRGPGGGGISLDPLIGLNDSTKPLRSKLLAVPKLREKYLQHVRTIAAEQLDWKKLGPVVAQYVALVEKEVAADTRKLSSFEAFQQAVASSVAKEPEQPGPGRREQSLASFAKERREFLLKVPAIQELARP